MSQRNVEIVRASMDAWNRRDWDAALAAAAPDALVDNTRTAGEWRGVHRGRDQIMRMWEVFLEPWESMRVEVEQYIDAGEKVVVRVTGWFAGRDGIEVQTKNAWCFTLHEGLITHVLISNDFEDALAAAGLSK
jgi:ketosteroid isomerase-like protein